ncbi:muconolactone Delta-isomerase [Nocardia sp. NPDC050793]|uniref:muconolactone Delta-isomerase n=1 Tax=Nocardia sp. NPDC050793 TaxID=3155159 RepID=UPI0033E472D5
MALFHVRMDVRIPHDLDPDQRAQIVAREKDYSQRLQRSGKWRHIWRIVGQYSNISVFDVDSADELHEILWNLPLFAYMEIDILPLTRHGSDIRAQTEHTGVSAGPAGA